MKMIVMSVHLRPFAAALAVSALLLTGCGGKAGDAGSAAGPAGQLEVVTAFYPFQYVAERVAGTHATVTSLTSPGAEPHDLELTPRQVGSLGSADLVVYEKTFQPAVDEAVAQSGASNVLDVATVVPLQPVAAGTDSHAHDGTKAGTEQGHDHAAAESGLDPHLWLDPTNLATIAAAIAERLSTADPTHAADYAANAKAVGGELSSLDQAYRSGLASCRQRAFITTHAAFGYLARRYGLTQIGISGLSPEAEPSPARVAEVQREATAHHVTTIFYETLVSPATATSIARDLGLATDVLDPLEGITDTSRGRDYIAVMTSNLAALQKANACG